MLNRIVIIAAGGTGSRMQSNLPKQYMLLQDKPVLMHTLSVFAPIADKIIVAIHPDMFELWNDLCQKHQFNIKHEIVFGGKTRFQSVKNAIDYLFDNYGNEISSIASVAVHDAARPLVDISLVEQSYQLAEKGSSNVLAVSSTNSIRIGDKEKSSAMDRNQVWQIQTPQTFPAKVIKEAYTQEESALFTDDASVVEKIGYPIQILESNNKNIKITFSEDFEIANIYLKNIR